MTLIKKYLMTLAFAIFVFSPLVATVPTQPAMAATDPASCARPFLTFPAWYRGLTTVVNDDCVIQSPTSDSAGGTLSISDFIWRIVLNVIEIGLQLVGYVAVLFIIYGGFKLLSRGDNSGKVEEGKKLIQNAIIGLVLSIASIAIINLALGVLD